MVPGLLICCVELLGLFLGLAEKSLQKALQFWQASISCLIMILYRCRETFMAEKGNRSLPEQLDEMALKIMMIEPGDLSVVGELVVLVEDLKGIDEISDFPNIAKIGMALEEILSKIVMMELPDSDENYELVGKAIAYAQELYRKKDDDEKIVKAFHDLLKKLEDSALEAAGAVGRDSGSEPAADVLESTAAQSEKQTKKTTMKQTAKAADTQVIAGPPTELRVLESPPFEAMDFLQDQELLSGFVEEATEHLESIEINVLNLEDTPGDLEIINNIFRPFHTIKGVSGFLNLKNIQTVAHSTENLLDDVRNSVRPMDSDVIDVVLKVGDFLKTMIEDLRKVMSDGPEHYKNYDVSGFVNWVKAVQGCEAQVAAAPPGAVEQVDEDEVERAVPQIDAEKPPAAPTPQAPETPPPAAAGPPAAPAAKAKVGATIKVDVEKLDGLVNAVGELVIMQAMVRSNPLVHELSDPKLTKDFSQLSRITGELQKTAMSMRMVPIRQTFQKMIRLVRDLSIKSGKQVNLVMEGEETEIDRNMVDSIYDPLVHMMRNSVDHGVQTPAEREKLGKPISGTVSLRAYQKGGNMVIEIEDDGQGLNTEKIRSKAIERGLIQAEDNLTAHELNNLIFLPGFSTADQITDVSGRGVGMDVVKKAVEKLRGQVEVVSESGKGSLFYIRLPLTLAIIDGIIVRVGNERYILPTTAIKESLKPEAKHYNTIHGKGETLVVRKNIIPIVRLYELFSVEPQYTTPTDAIVVIIETEGKQRAIMVDELLGKQEVVIKNLGGLTDIPGVAGGTILGDGRVGLILDLAGLVHATKDSAAETF
jgi:two-component system chemotaxis sensor kinase CheA